MINRSRLRFALAITFAISAVGILAGPAAAETTLVNCNGKCGSYQIRDGGPPYGANCIYEKVSYDLDSMSVRPPLMHGYYPNKTPVRWRFKILHQSTNGGAWSLVYTSSYQAAMADDAVPAYAGHGFSRRSWTAPESTNGRFKAWVEMQWLHNGGVEGFARSEMDNYKRLWNGNTDYAVEYCLSQW